MKIFLLARRRNAYSTRRFRETAESMGHELTVLDPLKCTLLLATSGPEVFYSAGKLAVPDVLLGRVSASTWSYGLAVVEQFELMGVPVLNPSLAISHALDCVRSLQLLAAAGLPVVRSVMVRSPRRLRGAVSRAGGPPVLLKLLKANIEVGAIAAETFSAAESTLETLWELGQNILLQQHHAGAEKGEIRVFVVAGQALAAVRRAPQEGLLAVEEAEEAGSRVELTEQMAAIACDAARVIGLGVAGVDMQDTDEGLLITGVHASPGIKWIERLSGIDAARAVLEHAVRVARGR